MTLEKLQDRKDGVYLIFRHMGLEEGEGESKISGSQWGPTNT